MNRITSGNSVPNTTMDKAKDWQLEILMEKLRSKASQYKSLPEISKNVRMTLLEKRYALDSVEKSQHQKCLDTLQHSLRVTSLQSMVERLESLTRQLGLKFVVESSGVFISSDMFYLEIVLDPSGAVKDVKIHHEGKMEQQSCAELVNCLSRGDFADFTAQLEGFTSIYQLNAEKKVKCKAFTALESLEADLSTLAQLQMFMKEPFNLLHKSPVGVLEKRKGGHPMKLTYFVSPYDLLNVEKYDIENLNIETVISKSLGYSVTVCMEGSAAHKLQTTTLITVNRSMNGKSTPSYSQLTAQNSAVIPACFTLKLNKPMPMSLSLVRQIQQIQNWTEIDSVPAQPLLNLIVTHSSEGKMQSSNNRGLFVTLPDQNHCYFMTENKSMNGVLVHSIPFTHPAHVANILKILREQALFNTIIGSCVRPNSRQDFENMTMLEISALSSTHISISLEHPMEESMATVEVDLTEISNLVCNIHNTGTPPPVNAADVVSELGSKILNRCFSIPITLRSVIKMWENQAARRNHFSGHENFSLPLGSGDPGGHKGTSGNSLTEFGGLEGKIKQEPLSNSGHGMIQSHPSMFLNESMMANANFQNFPSSEGVLSNMELTNILSGATDKSSKRQKRKASDDLWRGGKRKVGDEAELMESSSCDSTSRSTPLSQETEIPTPNSALGFPSDLELSGLDPTELLGTTDKSQPEFDNIDELGDVEEMLASESSRDQRRKSRDQRSPSNSSSTVDMSDKSLIPANLSITPVSTTPSAVFCGETTPEKRQGMEMIPLATSAASLLPSSITITPVMSSQSKSSEEKSRERKSSKSRSDEKSRLDKKRKRKRDESPMGPPDKVPVKQDPLSKPVSVSIKPAESPPLPPTPTSPNMLRKFSASPTQNRNMSISGKLSPNLIKSNMKTSSSSHHSPKHSPAHVPSSPKHGISATSSPKNHGASPKHPSTSGSGKPSMSTLKSATNSPSSKSSGESKSKSTSKESSRDKDKKLSSVFNTSNSKSKSSTVKVKPLDFNAGTESVPDGLPSPTSTSDSSKSNTNQIRNRKVTLSSIVDKLKNAQHCDVVTGKSNDSSKSSGKIGETKNSEYMVKPSSDGMKLTINKTRSKDSKSSSLTKGTTSSGSPKVHTGLKPGVNSGPASKKPQQLQKSGSSGSNISNSASSSSSSSYSSSSGNLKSSSSKNPSSSAKTPSSSSSVSKSISKMSSSPKTGSAADLSRTKDRPKMRSGAEKSIFSSKDGRKSSPTQNRDDSDSVYKLAQSKIDPYSSPSLLMEGFVNKLDKNFQIPKLSARTSDDKKSSNKSDTINNVSRSSTVDTKIFDMMAKSDISKYPLAIPNSKLFDSSVEQKMRNNMNSVVNSLLSSKNDYLDDKRKEGPQNLSATQGGKDEMYKLDPISASKSFSSSTASSEPLSLSTKSIDLTSKFAIPAPKEDKKDSKCNKSDSDLLDFTSGKSDLSKSGTQPFPQSPSVSVHIVKSPSSMVNPSPHSASPCITDDELMDEALIGLGK